jgi:hypothetical protein
VNIVETNDKPIDQLKLEELIRTGIGADLILEYLPEVEHYNIYARYHAVGKKVIVRQIHTQRKNPRTFKSLPIAIEWAKKLGFKSISSTLLIILDSAKKKQTNAR